MRSKVLLILGIVIFIFGLFGVNYLINNNQSDLEIPNVKLKEQINKKDNYAILLQQDDGTYKESTSTTFNQPGYTFNNEKSSCIDQNGNKIENALNYNDSTKLMEVNIGSTAYCYVYFDKNDIEIKVKTEGVMGKLPTTGGYKNTLTCSSGTATFSDRYQRLEITSPQANCTLNYEKTPSTYTSLINTVKNASEIVNEGDAGYRYEGTNPNNYIWFNNEMWRIIGLIPTKVDASGTTTNLVKIIRKDSLGGITYDAKSSDVTGAWGSNTLYTLLNEYYYGKKDGTNTTYCYGYSNTAKSKCDYRVNGISSDSIDFYGRMVKNVYWNTGISSNEAIVGDVYVSEKTKQIVQGKVGLISASDYGYAAGPTYHNENLSTYYSRSSNWLCSPAEEWTSTQYSSDAYVNYIGNGSIMSSFMANYGFFYRPVVYLNENVYVISGSGTEAAPYIIGM